MTQYSAFFLSLVTVGVLWGTGNDPLIAGATGVALVSAALSLTSYAFAVRNARDRSQKVAAGLRLRGADKKDVRQSRRQAAKVKDTDYDFVPGWITYAGMALALGAVLLLGYAVVVRFLIT